MSAGGTLNQARLPSMAASSSLFSSFSAQICASITAAVSATAPRGFFATQSARIASDFSGWSFQISAVRQAV